MANYSLTVAPTFTPFSYDELSKPVSQSAEMHAKVLEAETALAEKAAVWEKLLDENTDAADLAAYRSYMDKLNNTVDRLNRYGIQGASTLNDLKDLRYQFAHDISPIEVGWNNRHEVAKMINDAMLKNPNLMPNWHPNSKSVSYFYQNPDSMPELADGKWISEKAAGIISNLKTELQTDPSVAYSTLVGWGLSNSEATEFIKLIEIKGQDSSSVIKIMSDRANAEKLSGKPGSFAKVMGHIEDEIHNSIGYDQFTPEIQNRIDGYIRQNAPYAIGTGNINLQQNPGYDKDGSKDNISYDDVKFEAVPSGVTLNSENTYVNDVIKAKNKTTAIQVPVSASDAYSVNPTTGSIMFNFSNTKTEYVQTDSDIRAYNKKLEDFKNKYEYLRDENETDEQLLDKINKFTNSLKIANFNDVILSQGSTNNSEVLEKAKSKLISVHGDADNSVQDNKGINITDGTTISNISKNIKEVLFTNEGVKIISSRKEGADQEYFKINLTKEDKHYAYEASTVFNAMTSFSGNKDMKVVNYDNDSNKVLNDGVLNMSPQDQIKLFEEARKSNWTTNAGNGVEVLVIRDVNDNNDIIKLVRTPSNVILASSMRDIVDNNGIGLDAQLQYYYTVQGYSWLGQGKNLAPSMTANFLNARVRNINDNK